MEMITYRKLSSIILVLLMMFTLSCEDQIFPLVDCNNCLTQEPASAKITIRVISYAKIPYFTAITINVYEGDDTTGERIYWYSPTNETTTIDVALNRTYTIEAVYSLETYTYRAIDTARPTVKYTESECEEACWYVYDNKVNLRLKYR
jgi:hypothetical protein